MSQVGSNTHFTKQKNSFFPLKDVAGNEIPDALYFKVTAIFHPILYIFTHHYLQGRF